MGRVISASRRTDIPCLYAEWFATRVRAGYCVVGNPFNPDQLRRVDLRPDSVDVVVFWTKEPSRLMPYLAELDGLGYRYYFQYTITAYPRRLEPRLPPLEDRLDTFRRLSETVGPAKVIWRYDPIILSQTTDCDFHHSSFERIARDLVGHTQRVVISIVDHYTGMARRMRRLEPLGMTSGQAPALGSSLDSVIADMAGIACSSGMEIVSCAEKIELAPLGVRPGKCIDDEYIQRVFGVEVSHRKDPGQRPECGCVESTDIGAYDSCVLGCAYCYATRSARAARRRHAEHDPASPSLVGWYDVAERPMGEQQRLW